MPSYLRPCLSIHFLSVILPSASAQVLLLRAVVAQLQAELLWWLLLPPPEQGL